MLIFLARRIERRNLSLIEMRKVVGGELLKRKEGRNDGSICDLLDLKQPSDFQMEMPS